MNYIIMVSLDVLGAFDAAWWPSILCNLHALNCPRNLYNLARSYFSKSVAILHTNSHSGKEGNEGMCARILLRPRFLNVLYNALLNMKFSRHTKLAAFTNDLAILTHG
jgi:hypothetical protein